MEGVPDPNEVARLMDEIRDLMYLSLEISPAALNQLESLMCEIRKARTVALHASGLMEPTESMEAIEAWAEEVDSSEPPTYH
jgi:hypothetical protein